MNNEEFKKPDYIFEVSWEICNKVGGINTVLATKAKTMSEKFGDNYILIGPDLRQSTWDTQEFIEHPSLFKSWQIQAQSDGLSFRIGRWNVAGSPITILVDFTTYFSSRNQIFAHFWEKYQLDSISGGWDYIEPVMFGYAAGRIIESFYLFNSYSRDNVIAHFHHWMAASGILYLKEHLLEVSTVFTVHGTSLINAYANNGNMIYANMSNIDVGSLTKELNVTSKHSLEFLAAKNADVLTCVGDYTAIETEHILHRKPDFITYNGFDSPIPADEIQAKMLQGRGLLIEVAESLFGSKIDENSIIIGHSGRHQLHNKGIDIFIDTLKEINSSIGSPVLAYILVPTSHSGPRYEITTRLTQKDLSHHIEGEFLTHALQHEENDAIYNKIKEVGLNNSVNDRVKVIYVPCYLNGNDGVFNKTYYDLLPGFDLMVFPSYYEPWGYTPAESLAMGVPAITTSLTGFGSWIKSNNLHYDDFLLITERTEDNYHDVVNGIASFIYSYSQKNPEEKINLRNKALEFSDKWQWKNLINNYFDVYDKGFTITKNRLPDILVNRKITAPLSVSKTTEKEPEWRKVFVKTFIPEKLTKLVRLSKNLWWSWNIEAQKLFESINVVLWEKSEHNPIALLNNLSYDELMDLEKNESFINNLNSVYNLFEEYMHEKMSDDRIVAYFSMEFGIHNSLKIFSGGLGILAGDYLKEASDSNKNISGIGLLYRYGYFNQKITTTGEQISEKIPQKFSDLPVQPVRDGNGDWVKVSIPLPGRILYAKIWKVEVGRINLYLLDSDIDDNSTHDRSITHQLYGGNNEHRLKQEILLGIGGVKLLDALKINPAIYHCNEGHAAFSSIERLRKLIHNEKFNFDEALEIVRATTLFTTHTPVPAGHDFFSEELLRTYLPHYAERLNIEWESFINLGKMKENDPIEEFSMSVLAVKTSQEVNGVSRIHGKVSREMFNKMWKDYFPDELHIGYVTNGVHYPTWTAPAWQELYNNRFENDFSKKQSEIDLWKNIQDVSDETIWGIRQNQRKILIDFLKIRLMQNMTFRQENPKLIFEIIDAINDNALTIGFARRFATYKRAHLLFQDMDKLKKLLNNPEKPLMFIFSGKAHPADIMGQDLIKRIVEVSKQKDFLGKVIFIDNYDMILATKLVQGVDVWLNTPTRPLEASGTSGEKAIMNGVVNLSVLDGWWAEGYKPNAGWALKEEKTYQNQCIQDELDAETIYNIISDEIVPTFYERNENDIPGKWISYVKNTISEIAPHFTMNRMVNDYYKNFYSKLFNRSEILFNDNFKKLKELSAWKKKMIRGWDSIEVLEVIVPDSTSKILKLGDKFNAEVTLDLAELNANDIGIEIIFGQKEMDKVKKAITQAELILIEENNKKAKFSCEISITRTGVFDFAFRMYAKNNVLPHRQDFNLIRWF